MTELVRQNVLFIPIPEGNTYNEHPMVRQISPGALLVEPGTLVIMTSEGFSLEEAVAALNDSAG